MARKTIAERNLAAEYRAVEDGHRALAQDGGRVKVISDSFEGKWFEVQFVAHGGGLISFVCVPRGRQAYREDHMHSASTREGELPCKHSALAARRLEREGLATVDEHGRWRASGRLLAEAEERAAQVNANQPDDPWAGLPGVPS